MPRIDPMRKGLPMRTCFRPFLDFTLLQTDWDGVGRQRNPIKRDLSASSHHLRNIHLIISSCPNDTIKFAIERQNLPSGNERLWRIFYYAMRAILVHRSTLGQTRVGRLSRRGVDLASWQDFNSSKRHLRPSEERKKERIVACVADAATEIRSFSDPATSHA